MKSGFFCRVLILFTLCALAPSWGGQAAAEEAGFDMFRPTSRIDGRVEAAISHLLKRKPDSAEPPRLDKIAPLLEYMLVVEGGGRGRHPEKRDEGLGVYWRGVLNKPFAEALRYFFNPNIHPEILYPASLRRSRWLTGSDILNLEEPIWRLFENLGDEPLALVGREREEITPDDFSGGYYAYTQSRTLILLRYKGVPMLLAISWQDGKSEVGRKGGILGPYENWDFVYTNEVGGTASGIGWMSTYMYASASISLIFPQSGDSTGYSMFKWLKAGWAGLNVVTRDHIGSGADRNFRGMLEILDGANGVSVEELEEINRRYDSAGRADLLAEARPYAGELAKRAKNDEILGREEFQAVLANGAYAETLSDDELRSLLKVLALKRKLGKPVLGERP